MTSRTKLKRKEVDDVLGGEDQWKHADSTNGKLPDLSVCFGLATDLSSRSNVATCPKCDNGRAYFYQLQIRSADEPMTTCTCILVSGCSLADRILLDSLPVCPISRIHGGNTDENAVVRRAATIGEKTRHRDIEELPSSLFSDHLLVSYQAYTASQVSSRIRHE